MLHQSALKTQSKPRCHPQSILIVDDNENILELLAESFKVFGLKVFKAGNGVDAWKIFKKWSIDTVLTDIRMPHMDGADLSRRIRDRSPQTTIAVMTGGDKDVATRLLNDGIADHYFAKPFAISYVLKILSTEILTGF